MVVGACGMVGQLWHKGDDGDRVKESGDNDTGYGADSTLKIVQW